MSGFEFLAPRPTAYSPSMAAHVFEPGAARSLCGTVVRSVCAPATAEHPCAKCRRTRRWKTRAPDETGQGEG